MLRFFDARRHCCLGRIVTIKSGIITHMDGGLTHAPEYYATVAFG